jgi:hypothetical protein
MHPNHHRTPRPLNRRLGLGILLVCLFFSFAASGTNEVFRTYDYKGFDTNGNLLVSGVITLRLDGPTQVKGTWKLTVLNKDKLRELGPQDGSGKILGQLKDDSIFLNLNPDQFNSNIYLESKVARANMFQIKGKWGYYGFVGKLNEGNFEMERKPDPPR